MKVEIGQYADTAYLDKDLLESGQTCIQLEDYHGQRMRLLPAATLQAIPLFHLRLWCARHARYGLPTVELVNWLKEQIGTRKAIEIGSGNGDLAYHLGIHGTDNYCQRRPEVRAYYAILRQKTTDPTKEIEELDAVDAIKKHKPDLVIGSWITSKHKDPLSTDGNMFGPDEDDILALTEFIHIGNELVHGTKTILAKKHEEHRFPWLVSRSGDQSKNVIYRWSNLAV